MVGDNDDDGRFGRTRRRAGREDIVDVLVLVGWFALPPLLLGIAIWAVWEFSPRWHWSERVTRYAQVRSCDPETGDCTPWSNLGRNRYVVRAENQLVGEIDDEASWAIRFRKCAISDKLNWECAGEGFRDGLYFRHPRVVPGDGGDAGSRIEYRGVWKTRWWLSELL